MKAFTRAAGLALAMACAGCSTVSDLTSPIRNLWSGGPRELSQERPDAVKYGCDDGRQLTLLFDSPAKTVWVLLPEREYRLDAVASPAGERYSNGSTTVSVAGGEVSVEEGNVVTFSRCRQAQQAAGERP